MTLNKKISLGMMLGLLLMFLSVAVVVFGIQRQYYRLQLECSVRDIEISLGVMLAKPLDDRDNQQIKSLVNQIFDQGVFYLLKVRGVHNELVISRDQRKRQHHVPSWFVELVRWPSELQSITVRYDHKPVGSLLVSADPHYAYQALWRSFIALLYWCLLWLIMALLATYFGVRRLLTPLKRMTKQLHALDVRQFVLETKLPNTFEFQQMTMTMNQAVSKLKEKFQNQLQHIELLRTQLFQDPLTGFGNRRYFMYQLSSLLYRGEGFAPGFIVGVAIEQLVELKAQVGEEQVSELMKQIALVCFNFWQCYSDLSIAQIEEGRFVLIVRENEEHVFIKKCEEFSEEIQRLVSKQAACLISIAVVSYEDYHEQSLLMSELEQTWVKASNEPYNLAFSPNLLTHRQTLCSLEDLKAVIEQGLEYLYAQPVSDGKHIFHQEMSLKIPINDAIMSSAYLMPMIRTEGFARQLDSFMFNQVCEKDLLGLQPIAFTLSEVTLSNERFLENCLFQLKALPFEHRSRIHFEVDEYLVFKYFACLVDFYQELHDLGIQLGVKQAGIHFSTMNYLNDLPLSYLKLHGSLSHDMDEHKTFILRYFHEIAVLFGIKVIATEIQSKKEWQLLKEQGVRWGQGEIVYTHRH